MRLIDVDALKDAINNCDVCNNCPKKKAFCSENCNFPSYLTDDWKRLLDEQPMIIVNTEQNAE